VLATGVPKSSLLLQEHIVNLSTVSCNAQGKFQLEKFFPLYERALIPLLVCKLKYPRAVIITHSSDSTK